MARDEILYQDIREGDRVMTPEGYPGTVTEVWDQYPGHQNCVVVLDNAMGGGNYDDAELSLLDGTTRFAKKMEASAVEAGVEHTAATDYPELGSILADRLPMKPDVAASEYHGGRVLASRQGATPADLNSGHRFLAMTVEGYLDQPEHDQRVALDSMLEGYYAKGGRQSFASAWDVDTGEHRGEIERTLTAAAIRREASRREALYLPLTGSNDNDPLKAQANDNDGYAAGLADGKKGVARTPSNYTDPDYVASYQLGWARGVQFAAPPQTNWDTTRNPDNSLLFISSKTAGIWDFIRGNNDPSANFQPGHNWSRGDWCTFRENSRCMIPKDLDKDATEREGHPVWIPYDRGFCPRITQEQQMACPSGEARA